MKSHEVLKQACKKKSPKNVATHLNVALATLHRWSRPRKPRGTGAINPLDRIEAIQEFTGDKRLAEWVCQRAGGYFVANPKVKNSKPKGLVSATAGVMRELGHLQAEVAQVLEVGNVTKAECAELQKFWEESKSVTEGFVACCVKGDFKSARMAPGIVECADTSAPSKRRHVAAVQTKSANGGPPQGARV